jgi:hypothetical protein
MTARYAAPQMRCPENASHHEDKLEQSQKRFEAMRDEDCFVACAPRNEESNVRTNNRLRQD